MNREIMQWLRSGERKKRGGWRVLVSRWLKEKEERDGDVQHILYGGQPSLPVTLHVHWLSSHSYLRAGQTVCTFFCEKYKCVCSVFFVCMVGNCDARVNDLQPSIAFIQAARAVGQRERVREMTCEYVAVQERENRSLSSDTLPTNTGAHRFSTSRMALWVCVTLFLHLCAYLHCATTEAFCWWSKWHQIFFPHTSAEKQTLRQSSFWRAEGPDYGLFSSHFKRWWSVRIRCFSRFELTGLCCAVSRCMGGPLFRHFLQY